MIELRIGHRGAKAYESENTLRSFAKAIELGVNAVEFDVRRTKDNEIVVIHDEAVDRTTNGKGLVRELTLAEIKNLVIDNDEKVPTLEETLDFLDRKVKILIELKEKSIEDKVLKIVKDRGLKDNVIIISFHEDVIKRVREMDDEIETGLIYIRHMNPIKTALELKANYILPFYKFAYLTLVKNAHQKNLKVIVWTINTPEEAQKYAKRGVDGIASDKPDILKNL